MNLPGPADASSAIGRFVVRASDDVFGTHYRVETPTPFGSPGQLLVFARAKRLTLITQTEFFGDESGTRYLFCVRGREAGSTLAGNDVYGQQGHPLGSFTPGSDLHDEHGRALGFIARQFVFGPMSSTWQLSAAALQASGHLGWRRAWAQKSNGGTLQWIRFVTGFHLADDATGAPVMTSGPRDSPRDAHDVTVFDPRLDFRVAAAATVVLHTLRLP